MRLSYDPLRPDIDRLLSERVFSHPKGLGPNARILDTDLRPDNGYGEDCFSEAAYTTMDNSKDNRCAGVSESQPGVPQSLQLVQHVLCLACSAFESSLSPRRLERKKTR